MADFASIKRQFDGVQNTYVTLRKPYEARVNVASHTRKFCVSLVDTQLLMPGASKNLAALGELYAFPKLDPGEKRVVQADGSIEQHP